MRVSRHNKILELIKTNDVKSQDQLQDLLKQAGYDVTQATISRDIKELQLVKSQSKSGVIRYVANTTDDKPVSERFLRIFKETTLSYTPAQNLIVVRTLSGCSNAAAEAIDCLELEHIVGSIAGDNTLLVIVDNEKNVPEIIAAFDEVTNN
ncbi:MAG: arginine repressor [Clostridiales bacterium]|nr:arginine repressor [Candidatus Crickella equi]